MEKIEFYDGGKYEVYTEIDGIKQGKAVTYFNKDKTNKIWEKFTFLN